MRSRPASSDGLRAQRWSLAPGVAAFIRAAVRARPGIESCGLLVGRRGPGHVHVERATLSPNLVRSDRSRAFILDPRHLMAVDEDVRAVGESIVGAWHSHPGGVAHPSPRDEAELPRSGWIFAIAAPVESPVPPHGAREALGSAGEVEVTWWVRDADAGGTLTEL